VIEWDWGSQIVINYINLFTLANKKTTENSVSAIKKSRSTVQGMKIYDVWVILFDLFPDHFLNLISLLLRKLRFLKNHIHVFI
jgi:hypothetical protein